MSTETLSNDAIWISGGAPVTRRRMLGLAAGALAAGAAFPAGLSAGDLGGAEPGAAGLSAALGLEPSPVATPDEALAALLEGNRRFVSGNLREPNRTLARVRDVAPRQAPFAAVLACADSRVPVEILFDQGFGDVFVCRAAGNVATPEIIGSLEFGAAVLGAQVLMVLGHTACGAVVAAAKGDAVPGQISALFAHIRPAVQRAGADVEAAIVENARVQADLLTSSSPVIAGLVREGKLKVVAANYDLRTGEVRLV